MTFRLSRLVVDRPSTRQLYSRSLNRAYNLFDIYGKQGWKDEQKIATNVTALVLSTKNQVLYRYALSAAAAVR